MGDESDDPEAKQEKDELEGLLRPGQTDEPGEGQVEDALAGEGPGDGVPEGGDGGAPTLKYEGSEDDSLPELGVGAGEPLVLDHARRYEQNEEIDGVETGEAGEPELALVEIAAAVGIVVGKDVAGDEEEDSNEDVSVVDEGVEKAEMRRGEVEEDDEDGEEGADAGEGGQLRLSRGRRLRCCCSRFFGFELRLFFEDACIH